MFRFRKSLCGAIGGALLLSGCGVQESSQNPGSDVAPVTDVTDETKVTGTGEATGTKQSETVKTTTETKETEASSSAAGTVTATGTATSETSVTGTSATEASDTGSGTDPVQTDGTETVPTTAEEPPDITAETAEPGTTQPAETTEQTTPAPRGDYALDAAQEALLNDTVFVGDSIISMMYKNGTLPQDQIIAVAGIGVRTVFDTIFEAGGQECGVLDALRVKAADNVVCSFGLNDIRWLTEEEFTALYMQLLEKVKETLPESKVWLLTITPVRENIGFADNSYIDRYNGALRRMAESDPDWTLIDIAPALKNEANELKSEYDNGDGIHLSRAAYAPFLWQITDQMRHAAAEKQTQITE